MNPSPQDQAGARICARGKRYLASGFRRLARLGEWRIALPRRFLRQDRRIPRSVLMRGYLRIGFTDLSRRRPGTWKRLDQYVQNDERRCELALLWYLANGFSRGVEYFVSGQNLVGTSAVERTLPLRYQPGVRMVESRYDPVDIGGCTDVACFVKCQQAVSSYVPGSGTRCASDPQQAG